MQSAGEQSVPSPPHDKSTFPFLPHISIRQSLTKNDRVCTRSGTAVQTASSQQQHTVFTSTHSHLSPVDSLDVLWVTVLLCVQSDTHRRLWNRGEQWAKLSTYRGYPALWSWNKYLQYEKQLQIQCGRCGMEADTNYRALAAQMGFSIPLTCICWDFLTSVNIFRIIFKPSHPVNWESSFSIYWRDF